MTEHCEFLNPANVEELVGIAQESGAIQLVDPWITLKGLRLIYEMNE